MKKYNKKYTIQNLDYSIKQSHIKFSQNKKWLF